MPPPDVTFIIFFVFLLQLVIHETRKITPSFFSPHLPEGVVSPNPLRFFTQPDKIKAEDHRLSGFLDRGRAEMAASVAAIPAPSPCSPQPSAFCLFLSCFFCLLASSLLFYRNFSLKDLLSFHSN
ncbi:MAG: hypothetical protein HY885_10285 [Deltaproteobacteria bacterium]|nr:hypothetical protein [Deltaproteobacteria bacterium]